MRNFFNSISKITKDYTRSIVVKFREGSSSPSTSSINKYLYSNKNEINDLSVTKHLIPTKGTDDYGNPALFTGKPQILKLMRINPEKNLSILSDALRIEFERLRSSYPHPILVGVDEIVDDYGECVTSPIYYFYGTTTTKNSPVYYVDKFLQPEKPTFISTAGPRDKEISIYRLSTEIPWGQKLSTPGEYKPHKNAMNLLYTENAEGVVSASIMYSEIMKEYEVLDSTGPFILSTGSDSSASFKNHTKNYKFRLLSDSDIINEN